MSDKPTSVAAPLIVFAGGGTGGHLYPALALAEAFRGRFPRARFVFFGSHRPIEERILGVNGGPEPDGSEVPLVRQTLPSLRLAPWRWPSMYRSLRSAFRTCREQFERDPPMAVIGTGGLGSVPAIRQASAMGLLTALLNPDAVPGRANRFLASSVDMVFVQWAEAAGEFRRTKMVVVSGCPVRDAFNRTDRAGGLARFGLIADRPTLLVTGASQGARTVNEAVLENLPFFASVGHWQLLHLTGVADYETNVGAYSDRLSRSYVTELPSHAGVMVESGEFRATVVPYTEHMADALAAADLVVARAGASTLAEITAVGRASILMPYPYHKDMHQLANARCLVRASAARIVHDRIDVKLNAPELRHVLEQLMQDEAARNAMANAARSLGRGHASAFIADAILERVARRGRIGEDHGCRDHPTPSRVSILKD